MKPRRTDRTPHESRAGRLVPDSTDDLSAVAASMGRELTAPEAAQVRELISLGRDLRAGSDDASHGDVAHTLKMIAAMPDSEIAKALENCDQRTHDHIVSRVRRFRVSIQQAARDALANIGQGQRGAPEKWQHREIARRIVALWMALGNDPARAWIWGEKASPPARFAQAIFTMIERRPFDIRKTVRLLSAVKG